MKTYEKSACGGLFSYGKHTIGKLWAMIASVIAGNCNVD
jgi:hypothetical protein